MILTAIITSLCMVVAAVYSIKLGIRAKARSDELGVSEPPPDQTWARRWRTRARPWIRPALMTFAVGLIVLSLVYQSVSLSKTSAPQWRDVPPMAEPVRTAEWQSWRAKVHDKLAVEPVTVKALVEALRIKIPDLPREPTEAHVLRRDQAVADVLLSYESVREIFYQRFGIDKDFLGTGMSKPLGQTPYSLASVHEYLIDNHPDTHAHVWLWEITSLGKSFSEPIQTLLAGDKGRVPPNNHKKGTTSFEDDLKVILLRVKNKDHPIPPLIRFARFDKAVYKGTVGRPEATQVFTSNLSEVWDLTIQQAAEKSGYRYRNRGDTLFVWVFVPYHSNEFTPATWRQVLLRMPEWLESKEE